MSIVWWDHIVSDPTPTVLLYFSTEKAMTAASQQYNLPPPAVAFSAECNLPRQPTRSRQLAPLARG
jgi:hypothetical protein